MEWPNIAYFQKLLLVLQIRIISALHQELLEITFIYKSTKIINFLNEIIPINLSFFWYFVIFLICLHYQISNAN